MLGLDETLVAAVLDDWQTAPVDERMRAALRLLEKLTLTPDALDTNDVKQARAAGLSRQAIEEVAYVAFVFSVMDRLADVFDFTLPDDAQVRATGEFLNKHGYKLIKLLR